MLLILTIARINVVTTEANCYIEHSNDKRFSNILVDKNVNIDELNYLLKRLDGFDSR